MFTHRNIQDTNERGALMIEAIALLGLMTMMSPMVVRQTADRTAEMEEVTIAGQMKELKDALNNYISANYSTLANDIRTSALDHKFTVTANQLAPYLSAGLIEGNNFRGNKFMTNFQIGIRAQCTEMRRTDGNAPASVSFSGGVITSPNPTATQYCSRYRMTGIVLSEGDELNDRRAARIASMIGADGGSMRSSRVIAALGGNDTEKQRILGTQGVWEGKVSDYFANNAINVNVGGRVAATTTYSSGFSGDYLYRKPVDGLPDANSMFTDLDMGGATNCNGANCHNINNAGGLEVVGGKILIRSQNNAQGTNDQADHSGNAFARIALGTDDSRMQVTGSLNLGAGTSANLNVGTTRLGMTGSQANLNVGSTTLGMTGSQAQLTSGGSRMQLQSGSAQLNVGSTTLDMTGSQAQLNAAGTILSLNSTAARTSIGNSYTQLGTTNINMGVNASSSSGIYSNLQMSAFSIKQTVSGAASNTSIDQWANTVGISANSSNYTAMLKMNPGHPLITMNIKNGASERAELHLSPLGAISLDRTTRQDNAHFSLFSNQSQLSFTNSASNWSAGVNQGITSSGGKSETYVQKNNSFGASFALTATDFNIDIKDYASSSGVVTKQRLSFDSNGLKLFSTNQLGTAFDSNATIALNAKTGRVSGTVFQPENTMVIASNGQRGNIVKNRYSFTFANDQSSTPGKMTATPNASPASGDASVVIPTRGYQDHTNEASYNRFRVDPAFVSVMNDIKLTSRGGARLSDALPNYILKGIYLMSNTYTAGPWPCGYYGANDQSCKFTMPRYSKEQLGLGGGGWEFRCPNETDSGGATHPFRNPSGSSRYSCTSDHILFNYQNDKYRVCGSDEYCWAHPFMGIVPAPGRNISITTTSGTEEIYGQDEGTCPNGYQAVLTLTPTVFESGKVLAYDFNKVAGSSIVRYNPGYLDYSVESNRNIANIIQPGTRVGLIAEDVLEDGYIKGWKIAMGTMTESAEDPYFKWNVGGVITGSMSITAHTYCYFNPHGFTMPNMKLLQGGKTTTFTSDDNPMLNNY